MTNEAYKQVAIVHAALDLLPPLIRDSLLEDPRFRRKYGFTITHTVSLDAGRLVVEGSKLFTAVRRILSGSSCGEFRDTSGRAWAIQSEGNGDPSPTLFASLGQVRITLSAFAVLSPSASTRLRAFVQMAREYGIPKSAVDSWHTILSQRSLGDDDFGQLLEDIQTTLRASAGVIRNDFRFRKGSVKSLVPSSRKYFERLVGCYDASRSIEQYATRVARPFFESLSASNLYDGFLHSLLLSSHSSITAEISTERLERQQVVRASNSW